MLYYKLHIKEIIAILILGLLAIVIGAGVCILVTKDAGQSDAEACSDTKDTGICKEGR